MSKEQINGHGAILLVLHWVTLQERLWTLQMVLEELLGLH